MKTQWALIILFLFFRSGDAFSDVVYGCRYMGRIYTHQINIGTSNPEKFDEPYYFQYTSPASCTSGTDLFVLTSDVVVRSVPQGGSCQAEYIDNAFQLGVRVYFNNSKVYQCPLDSQVFYLFLLTSFTGVFCLRKRSHLLRARK
ncbi:hypothetical protein [Pedobacter frigidisoli]|uniref:hypothetical protein n=1 Tax=Pedobacter frigidisoli TaxID=2530455 RepID=UPI00292E2164|nr:hypothetical protein [Pedobacter frigidisoli]